MAVSETNADFKIDGKLQVTNVPNRIGTFVTLDTSNNTFSHRTASEVVADLGLNNLPIPVASSTVLGGVKIGSNLTINQDGVLSATDTNTTYSTATLAQLTTGTDTTGRLQTAKNMNDWLNTKSVFVTSMAGGIKTNNWTSNALSPYSIAIGHTTSAGGLGAVALGYGVTTMGSGSTNNGYQSTINGNFSSNVGSFNGINASKATNIGLGLLNDQEGCTVIGRFNAPTGSHDYENDANNSNKKIFVLGGGKDSDARKNIIETTADYKTKFASNIYYDPFTRNSIIFDQTTLIDKKYFDDHIPNSGTSNIQDYSTDLLTTTSHTGEILRGYRINSTTAFINTYLSFSNIVFDDISVEALDINNIMSIICATNEQLEDNNTLLMKGNLVIPKDEIVNGGYDVKPHITLVTNGNNVILQSMTTTEYKTLINTARNINNTGVMYFKLGTFIKDAFSEDYIFNFNPTLI